MRKSFVYIVAAGLVLSSSSARAQQYGVSPDDSSTTSAGAPSQAPASSGGATTETITAQPVGDSSQAQMSSAGPRRAEDAGWNAPWGLVFVLNNVLVTGAILSSYRSLGVAGVYTLGSDVALRGGVTLSRDHNPPQITKTTNNVQGQEITTYSFGVGGTTSSGSITASTDLLLRLMPNAVAPYVGVGAQLSAGHSRLTYDDDVSVIDQVTHVRNRTSSLTVGLRGVGGAEWRVHPNFAIFAEYEALLNVMTSVSVNNTRRTENVVGGTRAVNREHSERKTTEFLDFSNFLTQGASFGLMVLF